MKGQGGLGQCCRQGQHSADIEEHSWLMLQPWRQQGTRLREKKSIGIDELILSEGTNAHIRLNHREEASTIKGNEMKYFLLLE